MLKKNPFATSIKFAVHLPRKSVIMNMLQYSSITFEMMSSATSFMIEK